MRNRQNISSIHAKSAKFTIHARSLQFTIDAIHAKSKYSQSAQSILVLRLEGPNNRNSQTKKSMQNWRNPLLRHWFKLPNLLKYFRLVWLYKITFKEGGGGVDFWFSGGRRRLYFKILFSGLFFFFVCFFFSLYYLRVLLSIYIFYICKWKNASHKQ